jgi:hypothetical protein
MDELTGGKRRLIVQLDQVEGIQEHARVVVPIADAIEARDAVLAARNRLAVTMQERGRSRATASTISGKRLVRSLPGRL